MEDPGNQAGIEAAKDLYHFIEVVNAAGGFKKLSDLDKVRSALRDLCACGRVEMNVGGFSSPSIKRE